MPASIYDQLSAGLAQASRYGGRSILYRGQVLECAVLLGNTSTSLQMGGLQQEETVHVVIPRQIVPIGQFGEPHTNELVTFPARAGNGLIPRELMIREVIAEEWSYSFTLVDPSK